MSKITEINNTRMLFIRMIVTDKDIHPKGQS